MKILFKSIPFILMIFNVGVGICQTDLNCDSIYSQDSKSEAFIFYDRIAFPKNGLENFYKSVIKQTQSSKEKGKVVVQFVVDTLGKARCLRVVKSENELVNARAIVIISEAEFTPAEQLGNPVISVMVLPVAFGEKRLGSEKSLEQKRKKRKRS